jgi:hypothetical protein
MLDINLTGEPLPADSRGQILGEQVLALDNTEVIDRDVVDMRNDIVVVTRIFSPFALQNKEKNAYATEHYPKIDDIIIFSKKAFEYSKTVIVCIDVYEESTSIPNAEIASSSKFHDSTPMTLWEHAMELKRSLSTSSEYSSYKDRIIIMPVSPWGRYTAALNVGIEIASDLGFKYIFFQSFEFSANFRSAYSLYKILRSDPYGLVAGAALPGHQYGYKAAQTEGKGSLRGSSATMQERVVINGTNVPWNTFALWNLQYLSLTGFQLVSEGADASSGGVEEVVAISLLQLINPKLNSYLVNTSDIDWRTAFDNDEVRREYHFRKMKSKEMRPRKQMEKLGIPFGRVIFT